LLFERNLMHTKLRLYSSMTLLFVTAQTLDLSFEQFYSIVVLVLTHFPKRQTEYSFYFVIFSPGLGFLFCVVLSTTVLFSSFHSTAMNLMLFCD